MSIFLEEETGSVSFWKHSEGKYIYVVMTEIFSKAAFKKTFPKALEIDEEEFKQLHDLEDGPEVVTVADLSIIQEHIENDDEQE